MRKLLLALAIIIPAPLTSCMAPAFAAVFPAVWDGTCLTITSKYQHQNPKIYSEYQRGFVPPVKSGKEFGPHAESDNSDIFACLPVIPPANGMGPK